MTRRYATTSTTEYNAGALVFGGIGVGWLALVASLFVTDANPPIERVIGAAIPGWGLVAAGVYLWRKERQWLIVDLETRRASFRNKGEELWTAALDELAPLRIVKVQRTRPQAGRVRFEYRVICGSGARSAPIHGSYTYPPAKRFAERVARHWRIGLQPFDQRPRAFADLDAPIARSSRHHGGRDLTGPAMKSVTIEGGPDRATVSSKQAPFGEETPNVLLLVGAAMAGLAFSETDYRGALSEPFGNPAQAVLVVALGLGAVILLGTVASQTLRLRYPAAVIVDADRVSYRGRHLPTGAITEIVDAGGIHLFTPATSTSLPPGFSSPEETERVVEALRELVAAHGNRRPQPR